MRTEILKDSKILESPFRQYLFSQEIAIFCMFFRQFPENPSIRGFFRIFGSIFFRHETALKLNFYEKIEKFCRKSKNLRHFFRFFRFFDVFSHFFSGVSTGFFSINRLHKNVTFLKKTEKICLKSKILLLLYPFFDFCR